MEKPLALKVISIILIILGVIRLLGGVFGFLGYFSAGLENVNLLIIMLLENILCGILILVSGIMLIKGNKTGRILLIISAIIPPVAYMIFLQIFNPTFIIQLILILCLYFWPSIKEYFSN